MTREVEVWFQRNAYYWAGPGGWTICKVWLDGKYQYELWSSAGDQQRRVGAAASIEAAQALYEDLATEKGA